MIGAGRASYPCQCCGERPGADGAVFHVYDCCYKLAGNSQEASHRTPGRCAYCGGPYDQGVRRYTHTPDCRLFAAASRRDRA